MPRPYNVINVNGHIVPATRHDAIKKILVAIEEGRVNRLSSGRYRTKLYNGQSCLCAIGALMTEAQLDQVADFGANSGTVSLLAHRVGMVNVEAVTGMKYLDAATTQKRYDEAALAGSVKRFKSYLLQRLSKAPNYPNPATEHTGAWHFPVSGQ